MGFAIAVWALAEQARRRADFARFVGRPESRSRLARARRLRNERFAAL